MKEYHLFGALVVASCSLLSVIEAQWQDLLLNEQSEQARTMVSLGARSSSPSKPRRERANFPETSPHICLAFLSCCDRTDLLNHTLAGAIRHMEEDEPSFLAYEIAWVDNGSDPQRTAEIADSYQIEHHLTLPQNMGLAYGMNMLIFQLCTAPYVLLLEEDWLYLDELVAPQTPQRRRCIATSIALLENLARNSITAFDERNIMGVFLRHETYDTFLQFPLAGVWETQSNVSIRKELPEMTSSDVNKNQCNDENDDVFTDISYRVFCADSSLQNDAIWGSYTNGAGLYRRSDLKRIGRMYGEPGDTFHDRYVESNFAYRAGLHNCHAAIRLTDDFGCTMIHHPNCAGAFHHIGGGRGTRPMNAKGTTCDDPSWSFVGTPFFDKYQKYVEQKTGRAHEFCSREALQELRERNFRDADAQEYREQTRKANEEIFEREQQERDRIREEADKVLQLLLVDPGKLRSEVTWMAAQTDEEIREMAHRLKKLADSPHPMEGFWDSHGRISEQERKD